jgi:hypothetical protein
MATTAVFAEILVIGFQALIWLVLLIVAIVGPENLRPSAFSGWESLLTVLILVAAYSLGIVVDRAADSLLERLDNRLAQKYMPGGLTDLTKRRLAITMHSEALERFLDYARSRLRIARSTTINLALILITAIVLILTRQILPAGIQPQQAVLALLGIGIPFVALSYHAWHRISRIYYRRLVLAYEMVEYGTTTVPEDPS